MADNTRIEWTDVGALAVALFLAAPASADLTLRVIDGDTVEAGGVTYRLPNVDAAEPGAPCAEGRDAAERATRALARFLAGGRIEIVRTGRSCGWGRACADLIVNGESAVETGLAAGWLRPWPSCAAGRCRGADRPDWCEGESR